VESRAGSGVEGSLETSDSVLQLLDVHGVPVADSPESGEFGGEGVAEAVAVLFGADAGAVFLDVVRERESHDSSEVVVSSQ
jgi:hypothetical protein